ncbi:MAG: hypothetical protein AAGA72_12415 [Pseudomonadota bacterium]
METLWRSDGLAELKPARPNRGFPEDANGTFCAGETEDILRAFVLDVLRCGLPFQDQQRREEHKWKIRYFEDAPIGRIGSKAEILSIEKHFANRTSGPVNGLIQKSLDNSLDQIGLNHDDACGDNEPSLSVYGKNRWAAQMVLYAKQLNWGLDYSRFRELALRKVCWRYMCFSIVFFDE